MYGAGPIAFGAAAAPALLGGLGFLSPSLWWLMKTTPPLPEIIKFPGYSILKTLENLQQKPNNAPLWQRIIRMALATTFITALAIPQWKSPIEMKNTSGPVVLIVDNGWSAHNWDVRKKRINDIINLAEDQEKNIIMLTTAPEGHDNKAKISGLLSAKQARGFLSSIKPQAWPIDRKQAAKEITDIKRKIQNPNIFWLSNGIDTGDSKSFIKSLTQWGLTHVFQEKSDNRSLLLSLKEAPNNNLTIAITRINTKKKQNIAIMAFDQKGNPIHQKDILFQEGQKNANTSLDIPSELRRELNSISIQGEKSAGATILLDENWRKKSAGIVQSTTQHQLLSGTSYIKEAISPFTDIHEEKIGSLLKRNLSTIIMTDEASLTASESTQLKDWIENGGTLLRFAGPKLANQPNDTLLPVEILKGTDHIEKDFSQNNQISFGANNSPFHGLNIPENLEIKKRILPKPTPDLEEKTWAKFHDGSPLVTAKEKGKGRIILFHTTANLSWSNLPISNAGDLFINMMKTVISQSNANNKTIKSLNRPLPVINNLDINGKIIPPAQSATPITPKRFKTGVTDALTPPGFYGDDINRVALNISSSIRQFNDLSPQIENQKMMKINTYEDINKETNWSAWLLLGTLTLMGTDMITRGYQSGAFGRRKQKKRANISPS